MISLWRTRRMKRNTRTKKMKCQDSLRMMMRLVVRRAAAESERAVEVMTMICTSLEWRTRDERGVSTTEEEGHHMIMSPHSSRRMMTWKIEWLR
jgi:hypothetical protein